MDAMARQELEAALRSRDIIGHAKGVMDERSVGGLSASAGSGVGRDPAYVVSRTN